MEGGVPTSLAAQAVGQTNRIFQIPAFADCGVVEISESSL